MKFYFIIFLSFFVNLSYSQDEVQQDFQKIKSRYNYDITRPSVVDFNYFIDYSNLALDQEFHLAVSVQNDFLQFKKDEDKFISQYEISLIVRQDEDTWFSKSWSEDVELTDFNETNSKREYQNREFVVNFKKEGIKNLQAGTYDVLVEINDKLSSRQYKNKRVLKYSDQPDSTGLIHTDVAFSAQINTDSLQIPQITATRNVIDINQPYVAFSNVFMTAGKKVSVNIRLYKKEKTEKSLFVQDFKEFAGNQDGKYLIKYLLPYKMMDEGKYSVRFSISTDDSAFEIEKEFSVLWFFKPLYLYKVDLAVRPLKYLLTPEEMEKVKSYNFEELTKWFNAFWKKRDPDTSTVFNELEDVFYSRVTETVRSFSTRFKEGWQTDRGKIYLLYGEPQEIDNRIYSVEPHIIWKYTIDNQPLIFTFVDKLKTGDFVLIKNDENED